MASRHSSYPVKAKIADATFLKKQKTIYDLLWHTDLPEVAKKLNIDGVSYKIEANLSNYKNATWVEEFLRMYKEGLLPHGQLFSVFNTIHLKQAIALFKVFYTAKDFATLCKTATWAKVYVNEYLFVYAFSVAVFQHPETMQMRIPALHEIYPSLFFNYDVIRKAKDVKAYVDATHDLPESRATVIDAESCNKKFYFRDDWKLSYFTEDIELNNIPYYAHLAHPFWLSYEEFPEVKESRADRYFWAYKLQLARYNMERLVNGMGEIDDFDWDQPIPFACRPTTSFPNGVPLPYRELFSRIPSFNNQWMRELKAWEDRLSTAIDMKSYVGADGKFHPLPTIEGLKIFSNLFEGNVNSANMDFYGTYDTVARTVLGSGPQYSGELGVVPSAMELYGLDQRDPIYWSWIKKLVDFYKKFASKLPKHTFQELVFPGVRIKSVDVSTVTTYFTPMDYYISNAVKAHSAEETPLIKARQHRLAHKPFTYTVTVQSEKKTKGNIRIFVGPKYTLMNEMADVTEHWNDFIAIDEWMVDLEVGSNTFTRKSIDALTGAPGLPSGDEFYRQILNAIGGKGTFEIPRPRYGYPERMLIPKGKPEGFMYQFYFYVSPYNGEELYHVDNPLIGEKYIMDVPLGFPLDRPVTPEFVHLPNGFFKDVNIFHAEERDMNKTM